MALEAQDVGRASRSSAARSWTSAAVASTAVAAIGASTAARLPVIAVAQHDDQLTRRRARSTPVRAASSRTTSSSATARALVERWLTASDDATEPVSPSWQPVARRPLAPRDSRVPAGALPRAPRAIAGATRRRRCSALARGRRTRARVAGRLRGARPRATQPARRPPAMPTPSFLGPRLELAAAERCSGRRRRRVRLVAWAESETRSRSSPGLLGAREAAAERPLLVSDGLRAAFLLGLQARPGCASWGLASDGAGAAAPHQGRRGGRPACGTAAAAADRVIEAIVAGPLVGRTEADVAARGRGPPRRRGPRHGRVRHRRQRPEQRLAPPRAGHAGHRRRGSRCCSTSAGGVPATARTHAHVLGRPTPDGSAPDAGLRRESTTSCERARRRPRGGAGGRDVRVDRRGGTRASSRPAATASTSSTGSGTASASRSTRSRTSSGTTRTRPRSATRSASSRASTSRAATASASRTSWSARNEGGESLNATERGLRVVSSMR